MHVTILADASHCPDTRAGGYGYWIASERGKKGGSGSFKGRVVNSTVAEMMAIANSLYEAVRHNLVLENDCILFQTDCEAAIFAFTGKRSVTQEEGKVVSYVRKVVRGMKLTVSYKHVKGHTSNKQARFAANNACDRAARKAMRKARNLVRIEDAKRLLNSSSVHHETVS